MIATGLSGAYLHPIPNWNPLDLVMCCSGVLLGVRAGAGVAALTMLAYSLLNPYGAAPPLVTVSQVVGEAGYAVAGGVLARLEVPSYGPLVRAAALAVAAVATTVWFDLLTNLATAWMLGQLRATMIGGIPFALLHLAWNLIAFVAVGAALLPVLARYRARLSS